MNCLRKTLITILLAMCFHSVNAEVVLTTVQGEKIPFSSLKGKWVIINYWAGWCQSCLDEIGEFNAFYKNNKNKIALFAVNFDPLPLNEQKAMSKRVGIHYPSLAKNPRRQLGLGSIQGVPVTFIFNPQGRLVDTLYGGQSRRSLQRAIRGR